MDDMMLMIGLISDRLFGLLVCVTFDGRVEQTVSQGSDQSLTSCRPSKVTHTSNLNNQSEIGPIINMMLLIKGHTHDMMLMIGLISD
jgi:hypothetical protein